MDELRDTPPDVTDKLLRWGGRNPFGQPSWRILLAENHLVQRSGLWTEFEPEVEQSQFNHIKPDDGSAYVTEHDQHVRSAVQIESRQIAPDAIRVGTFWVPLYPCTGWILERWFSPSAIGNKDQWESAMSQDGETPMMGPFPDRGMYWMPSGGGPWDEIPPLESVRQAISQWENADHLHGEMDEEKLMEVMRRCEIETAERDEEISAAFLRETEYAVAHNLSFIKTNPALSGFRNTLTRKEGMLSHY